MKCTKNTEAQPERYLPGAQVGLQAILGTEGLPAGKILLAYGAPHHGKSSLFFHAGATNTQNGGDTIIIDTEQALDKTYAGSFFYKETENLTGSELFITATKHHLKECEAIVKDYKKKKDFADFENFVNETEKRIRALNVFIPILEKGEFPYPEDKIVLPGEGVTKNVGEKLIRDAVASLRLKKVDIVQDVNTFEKLESRINDIIAERSEAKDYDKNVFVIVDSITGIMTEKEFEKESSSDGNHFGPAKFLNQWINKNTHQLAINNITLAFVAQQNDRLKMSIFDPSDPILDVAIRGGRALKFAASVMIGISGAKEKETYNGRTAKISKIKLNKAKALGGGNGTKLGTAYLISEKSDSTYKTVYDFNEALFEENIKTIDTDLPSLKSFKAPRTFLFPAEYARKSPLWTPEMEESVKPLKEISAGKYTEKVPYASEDDEYLSIQSSKDLTLVFNNPYWEQAIKNKHQVSETSTFDDIFGDI